MAVATWGLMSCSKQEEPVKIIEAEVQSDNQEAVKYKQNRGERQIVVAMHYDWGTKPGYSLANTPDSLDMIVLKNNYAYGKDGAKMSDLKAAQAKATWVLPSIDMELKSTQVAKTIAADYKAAKKAQDAAWAKAGDKPTDAAVVAQTYEAIKRAILRQESDKLIAWVTEQKAFVEEALTSLGYNGISLRLPQSEDIFDQVQVVDLLSKVSSLAGQGKDKLFVVESPVAKYKEHFASANYLVIHKPELSDFVDYEAMLATFEGAKLVLAYDLADSNLSKGFKNVPIFSPTVDLTKDEVLLKYKHQSKAGIAVYHSEKYYYQTEAYKGFVNPYVPFKALINKVAQTQK